jgi:hypothetical protein
MMEVCVLAWAPNVNQQAVKSQAAIATLSRIGHEIKKYGVFSECSCEKRLHAPTEYVTYANSDDILTTSYILLAILSVTTSHGALSYLPYNVIHSGWNVFPESKYLSQYNY